MMTKVLFAALVLLFGSVQAFGPPKLCTSHPNTCPRGLVCAGRGRNRRCVRPGNVGQSCGGSSGTVCASPLVCNNHTCKIPNGLQCEIGRGGVNYCVDGSSCVVVRGRKVCTPDPVKVGGTCNAHLWCARGLVCEHNQCRIKKGDRCDIPHAVCVAGTKCLNVGHVKKCITPPVPVGGSCGGPHAVCDNGLVCQSHKCKILIGGECTRNHTLCERGAICKTIRSHPLFKKCVARPRHY